MAEQKQKNTFDAKLVSAVKEVKVGKNGVVLVSYQKPNADGQVSLVLKKVNRSDDGSQYGKTSQVWLPKDSVEAILEAIDQLDEEYQL